MIREATIKDNEIFNYLGLQITPNFTKMYKLEDELNNNYSHIKVFEMENKVVGYIHYQDLGPETNIINVVVDKKNRRCHIADLLLQEVLKNKKKVFLEVNCENTAAIALYEKHGFKKIGLRKGYYNGVDAITMVMNNE